MSKRKYLNRLQFKFSLFLLEQIDDNIAELKALEKEI